MLQAAAPHLRFRVLPFPHPLCAVSTSVLQSLHPTHHDKEEDIVCKVNLQQADDVGVLERAQHIHFLLHLLYFTDASELGPIHHLDGNQLICHGALPNAHDTIGTAANDLAQGKPGGTAEESRDVSFMRSVN
jgi:hypothetical protein